MSQQNNHSCLKEIINLYLGHFRTIKDFPGNLLVKNPLANAGDTGLIRGSRRFHVPLDI